MKKVLKALVIILLLAGASCWIFCPSKPVPLPTQLRTVACEGNKECLEIPIVTYGKPGWDGSLDFVGAVHLAEPTYYADLNKRFQTYDAVLFELIADPDRIAQVGSKNNTSILGTVQRKMADMLGMMFQLDGINYQAPNFVHADVTPAEMAKAMAARGESFSQLLWRMVKLSFDPEVQKKMKRTGFEGNELDGINPVALLMRDPTPEEQVKLRKFLAHGLSASDDFFKMLEGDNGSSIISDRNQAALRVLKHEIESGKKHLALFYGVGHLPDMDAHLKQDFGMRIEKVEWIRAWMM